MKMWHVFLVHPPQGSCRSAQSCFPSMPRVPSGVIFLQARLKGPVCRIKFNHITHLKREINKWFLPKQFYSDQHLDSFTDWGRNIIKVIITGLSIWKISNSIYWFAFSFSPRYYLFTNIIWAKLSTFTMTLFCFLFVKNSLFSEAKCRKSGGMTNNNR